jgi:hypothetical protein
MGHMDADDALTCSTSISRCSSPTSWEISRNERSEAHLAWRGWKRARQGRWRAVSGALEWTGDAYHLPSGSASGAAPGSGM